MSFDIEAITWDNEKRKNRAKVIAEEINKAIPIQKKWNALEFGCGTGDLCRLLNDYHPAKYVGVDIAKFAIDYAIDSNENENVKFKNINILFEDIGKYDLVITSNTLEHFKNPYVVIDRLLSIGDKLLMLLPYNEIELLDKYDCEGGAGHVFSFTENSFSNYEIIDWYTFYTPEWAMPPEPLQLVILIK